LPKIGAGLVGNEDFSDLINPSGLGFLVSEIKGNESIKNQSS